MPRTLSAEHLLKLAEGRQRRKELGIKNIKKEKLVLDNNNKSVLYLSGTINDAFDIIPLLRSCLRPDHKYEMLHKLERDITNIGIWKDVGRIVDMLNNFVTVKYENNNVQKVVKEKKERKKSNYTMTPEHKEKIRLSRMKKES